MSVTVCLEFKACYRSVDINCLFICIAKRTTVVGNVERNVKITRVPIFMGSDRSCMARISIPELPDVLVYGWIGRCKSNLWGSAGNCTGRDECWVYLGPDGDGLGKILCRGTAALGSEAEGKVIRAFRAIGKGRGG